ncbi:MAG: M1 family aminopeptidase [Cyclobacteriaceae bacterium]
MLKNLLLPALLFFSAPLLADTYPKNTAIDALHYAFAIKLSDQTDVISVTLTMDVRFKGPGVNALRLDLMNLNTTASAIHSVAPGKGMQVSSITRNGESVAFNHSNNVLTIPLSPAPAVNEDRRFVITYSGIPSSGLKIANNKYGERTFFSDNWPDQARHWLAVIDHPYDKATSEFIVTAPNHYQVVSNGLKVEQSDLSDGLRLTHWKQGVPIAPWLYVLGVARFAVQYVDQFEGKSIETWVYAKDRDAGFIDFAEPSKDVLAFYTDYIGPYAYERLANIQSNSVSGGMEAASAILYSESSVSGKKDPRWRNVVIHEIAHQWFGNAVTEFDWDDVWLSEGFATYFTLVYLEHSAGHDEFVRGLIKSREQIISYLSKNPDSPIVHNNLNDMSKVTSALTYQKGAWVLHMLRHKVGEVNFQRGIRSYYKKYFNGNATTNDFRQEMEQASGMDLMAFFKQWLNRDGLPNIKARWKWDPKTKELLVTVSQKQSLPFSFPLEFGIRSEDQNIQILKAAVDKSESSFSFPMEKRPLSVSLDPQTKLLGVFEEIQD